MSMSVQAEVSTLRCRRHSQRKAPQPLLVEALGLADSQHRQTFEAGCYCLKGEGIP
jgi:hypothetical protein